MEISLFASFHERLAKGAIIMERNSFIITHYNIKLNIIIGQINRLFNMIIVIVDWDIHSLFDCYCNLDYNLHDFVGTLLVVDILRSQS